MKRIVCMLLALVLSLYLPCTAFATSNPYPSITTPQTGDASMIYTWVVVMVVALLALIVAVVMMRKSKKA